MRRVATGIMGPSVLIDVCLASEEKPEQNISYWENSPGMNRKGNMALFLLWRVLLHICLTLPGFRFELCLLSLLRSRLLTAPHCQTAPSSQTYFFVFAYTLLLHSCTTCISPDFFAPDQFQWADFLFVKLLNTDV